MNVCLLDYFVLFSVRSPVLVQVVEYGAVVAPPTSTSPDQVPNAVHFKPKLCTLTNQHGF